MLLFQLLERLHLQERLALALQALHQREQTLVAFGLLVALVVCAERRVDVFGADADLFEQQPQFLHAAQHGRALGAHVGFERERRFEPGGQRAFESTAGKTEVIARGRGHHGCRRVSDDYRSPFSKRIRAGVH